MSLLSTSPATVQLLMRRQTCNACGGGSFHRLGCPALERSVFTAAAVLGTLTVVIAAGWLAGGPTGNVVLGASLTLFFVAVGLLSRRTRRSGGAKQ